MFALTVHAPWAWAILAGHKPVENRTWRPPPELLGRRIAIHAGRSKRSDYEAKAILRRAGIEMPPVEILDEMRGRVCGTVAIAGVVPVNEAAPSPLACGPQCWLLEQPQWLLPTIAADGKLGLWQWEPPAPTLQKVAPAGDVQVRLAEHTRSL